MASGSHLTPLSGSVERLLCDGQPQSGSMTPELLEGRVCIIGTQIEHSLAWALWWKETQNQRGLWMWVLPSQGSKALSPITGFLLL